jgi:hypothetical protein
LDKYGKDPCISFGGLAVDRAVSERVLEALRPQGIQAALEAWEECQRQEDEKKKALRLAVEKASYEVELTRRQYDAVDPDNRLVAGELEARWEKALRDKRELEARLEAASREALELGEEDRDRLLELGGDLQELWNHEEANPSLKKRLLRTVLEEVIVDSIEEPPQLKLLVHWSGGVHTSFSIPRRRPGQHRWCTDKKVLDLVRELAKVCSDRAIAATLNRLGYRTAKGLNWKEVRVRSLRGKHDISVFDKKNESQWVTLGGAAKVLGISPDLVKRLIERKILPGRQVVKCAPWVIGRKDLDLPAVRDATEGMRHGNSIPCDAPGQLQFPFIQQRTEV